MLFFEHRKTKLLGKFSPPAMRLREKIVAYFFVSNNEHASYSTEGRLLNVKYLHVLSRKNNDGGHRTHTDSV